MKGETLYRYAGENAFGQPIYHPVDLSAREREHARYRDALEWIVRDASINPPGLFNGFRLARRYVERAAQALSGATQRNRNDD